IVNRAAVERKGTVFPRASPRTCRYARVTGCPRLHRGIDPVDAVEGLDAELVVAQAAIGKASKARRDDHRTDDPTEESTYASQHHLWIIPLVRDAASRDRNGECHRARLWAEIRCPGNAGQAST